MVHIDVQRSRGPGVRAPDPARRRRLRHGISVRTRPHAATCKLHALMHATQSCLALVLTRARSLQHSVDTVTSFVPTSLGFGRLTMTSGWTGGTGFTVLVFGPLGSPHTIHREHSAAAPGAPGGHYTPPSNARAPRVGALQLERWDEPGRPGMGRVCVSQDAARAGASLRPVRVARASRRTGNRVGASQQSVFRVG